MTFKQIIIIAWQLDKLSICISSPGYRPNLPLSHTIYEISRTKQIKAHEIHFLPYFSLRSWRDSWADERRGATYYLAGLAHEGFHEHGLFTNPLTASPLAFTASLPKQKHARAKSRQLRRLAIFWPIFFVFCRKFFSDSPGFSFFKFSDMVIHRYPGYQRFFLALFGHGHEPWYRVLVNRVGITG